MPSGSRHAGKYDLTEFWQLLSEPAWPPEYRLIIAVLQRAVLDFTDEKAPAHLREEAAAYIFSPREGPWSCRWIFEMVFEEPFDPYERFIAAMAQPDPPRPTGVAFRCGWK